MEEKKTIGSSLGERRLRICFCNPIESELDKRKYEAAKMINELDGYSIQLKNRQAELNREYAEALVKEGYHEAIKLNRISDEALGDALRNIAIAQTKVQEMSFAFSYVLSDPVMEGNVKFD